MDNAEVKKLWALLGALYPSYTPARTKERLAAWQMVLAPYTYAEVKDAALEHARYCRFYPSVSELVARVHADRNAWMDEYISDKKAKRMPTGKRDNSWMRDYD